MLATKILSRTVVVVCMYKCDLCSDNEMPIDKADHFGVLGNTDFLE